MFLKLDHQKLNVYLISRGFVFECYKLTKFFPSHEKFGMIQQIRRAALSVHLNLAEGFSRKSEIERKRFFEISRGSIIEVDAALDIAFDLKYLENANMENLGKSIVDCYKYTSGLIKASTKDG